MAYLVLGILGLIGLAGIGLAIWGTVVILVAAFRTDVKWGCGSLVIPFVMLVFVFKNWEEMRRPFLYSLGGNALAAAAGIAALALAPMILGAGIEPTATPTAQLQSPPAVVETTPVPAPPTPLATPVGEATAPATTPSGEVERLLRAATATPTPIPPSPTPSPSPVPIARVHDHVGQKVELILTSGESIQCVLIGAEGGSLTIRRDFGGGSITHTLKESDVESFRLLGW